MSNAIQVIFPFQDHGVWVFTDVNKGLEKEPFICGVPTFIDAITVAIPDAAQGFAMYFSPAPFPGYQMKLDFVRAEFGGSWYEANIDGRELQGWFCPILLLYFAGPPAALYARAEPLKPGTIRQGEF